MGSHTCQSCSYSLTYTLSQLWAAQSRVLRLWIGRWLPDGDLAAQQAWSQSRRWHCKNPRSPAFPLSSPNGFWDTCRAHQCSVSQMAIFCGPSCVKLSSVPHVFVTQQQKVKMLHSHTLLDRKGYYVPGRLCNKLTWLSLAPLQCALNRKHTLSDKQNRAARSPCVGERAVRLPVQAPCLIMCQIVPAAPQ